MNGSLVDLLVQLALVAVYAVLAAVLGAVGLYVEYHSLLYATAGDLQMGAWTAVFGLMALVFAYLLFRDRVVPTARTLVG